MDPKLQAQFMYLFERVGEPLYFGPRGSNNTFFNVPVDGLPRQLQDAINQFRQNFGATTQSVSVSRPSQTPNLKNIGRACPRDAIFGYFIPSHRKAADELKNILMEQPNLNDFLSMSTACRDNDMVNPRLFVYAFASCCLRRPDMKGFRMPAFWEVAPDQFISPAVIRTAQRQSVIPERDRSIIVVDRNLTANDTNPENLVAYFREDIGINSHHWHWHLIYPTTATRGQRDRKGELFYYMHHDMLARYNSERLCNGLHRTKRLDINEAVTEGYFPKLYNSNAGIIWGVRQENSKLQSVDRSADTRAQFTAELNDMAKWRDRIVEAIDTGLVIGANGDTIRLTPEQGIDVLGDLVEASDLTPNRQVYGDWHNNGHILIACVHDPKFRHKENIGVMGDSATAMRDPVFYRWHKHVDEIFDRYKGTLKPYTTEELAWQGIQVTDVSLQTSRQDKNTLVTNWMQSDIDLSRGVDFGRTSLNNLGSIWARVTHLNHEDFAYRIQVNNSGPDRPGTVRIFMAPRNNEQKHRFDMAQQRLLFFEMDKFRFNFRSGQNVIERRSTESSVTIPWEQSFRDLERSIESPTASQAVCGCGWPQHMLIPRGNTSGVVFDVYVIITDFAQDQVPRKNRQTEGQRQGCKESISYCGLLDELYPDKRAMGFPFDRHPRKEGNSVMKSLDQFIKGVSNSGTTQIRIVHRDTTVVRGGGAPSNMGSVTTMESRPSSPDNSRPPSPIPNQTQNPNRPSSPGGGGGNLRPQSPGGGPINFGGRPTGGNGGGRPGGAGGGPNWNRPGGGGWGFPGRQPSRSPSPPGWTTISHASSSSGSFG